MRRRSLEAGPARYDGRAVVRLRSVSSWIVAAALAQPAPVHAYERTTVDGQPDILLAWPVRSVVVQLADDTSRDLTPEALHAALGRSLGAWSMASTEAAPGPCTDMVLRERGAPSGVRTNLMGGTHDGLNRIVFREDAWPAELGPETLAITTLVYRRSTGEILDADIDVNAVDHPWSVEDVSPADAVDVENTLTHEFGHFLGFAHVSEADATMYGVSEPGDVLKRTLASDDVAAMCAVYPLGGRTPGGRMPRGAVGSGCSVVGAAALAPGCARPGATSPWTRVTAALVLLCSLRAARRARRGARRA